MYINHCNLLQNEDFPVLKYSKRKRGSTVAPLPSQQSYSFNLEAPLNEDSGNKAFLNVAFGLILFIKPVFLLKFCLFR